MGRNVFLVVQIPFCDLRRFFIDPPEAVSKPSWPSPGALEFIRRFGKVRSRELHPIDGKRPSTLALSGTERHFVDATKYIDRQPKRLSIRSVNSKVNAFAAVKFLRVIGDGTSAIRFEVGIDLIAPQKTWHTRERLREAVNALLLNHRFETRFTQAISGKTVQSLTLQSLGALLRRHYFVASELHDSSGEPTPFESSLIRPLDWTIVASLPQTRTYRWLRDDTNNDHKGQAIDAAFMRGPLVGNLPLPASFPVIGNYSRKEQDQARRFRIRFLRSSAEMKALSLISAELNGGSLYKDFQSNPDQAQEKLFQLKKYYTSTLNRIKDTIGEIHTDDLTALVLHAVKYEGHLTQDKLRTIIGVSTNAVGERLVEKSITTIFAASLEINQGDNMSKYTFNAPAQGQFGDGGTANFAESLIQGKASESQMSTLAQELGQVLEALERDKDQSDEAAVAIASVKAAKNAAENGDQSKVMGFLKSAGAWTLEKSAAIGVPVAIAALKKAIGA